MNHSDSSDVEIYSKEPITKSSLRDFLTVLALSLHAVFEGLAVGLEDEIHGVWILFAGKSYFFEYLPTLKP